MAMFQREDFAKICEANGMLIDTLQADRFACYAEMLIEWNQRMNLTAITDLDAIYEKHFLDSLLPAWDVPLSGRICDVGSGAGFPAIPLKIAIPSLEVVIVEPLGKRITFLNSLCEALGIHVELVNERAEDYAKTHRETFDFVLARAVANLPMLCELCIPLVRKQGKWIAMKGANAHSEQTQAEHAVQMLGAKFLNAYERELSDGSKRINLVYEKVKSTPKHYPRPFAQIKKHPL